MKLVCTSNQIRAGRGLLGWSQQKLAQESEVHVHTVGVIERNDSAQNVVSRMKIQATLEKHGVMFLPALDGLGDGVRFSKPPVRSGRTKTVKKLPAEK